MLGDKIRTLRKENKISQEELAEKLCVSRQSVSLWENGQTMPSIENIVSIASIFNVSTDVLLKEDSKDEAAEITEGFEEEGRIKKPRKKKILTTILIMVAMAIVVTTVFVLIANRNLSAEEIYNIASPSTVEIQIQTENGLATGTGFFLDEKGTIVTNFHVIENAKGGDVFLNNGEKYKILKLVGFDSDLDIALIQIDYTSHNVLPHRKSMLKTGETVYALGSSLGLSDSFSKGIVSANSRELGSHIFIQITCPISHGNSGGPLIDCKGNVVGITSAVIDDGQNLNFAIPIANLRKIDTDTPVNFIGNLSFLEWVKMKKNDLSYWEWVALQ